jgi:hypothetical protein
MWRWETFHIQLAQDAREGRKKTEAARLAFAAPAAKYEQT